MVQERSSETSSEDFCLDLYREYATTILPDDKKDLSNKFLTGFIGLTEGQCTPKGDPWSYDELDPCRIFFTFSDKDLKVLDTIRDSLGFGEVVLGPDSRTFQVKSR